VGIYFVSNGESVKIGYTGGDAKSRIRALQTGNPASLQLLAFKKDWDKPKEAELHSMFAKFRQSGEWFSLADELKSFILSLNPMAFQSPKAKTSRPIAIDYPATPEANEASTEACFSWYKDVWDSKKSARLPKLLGKDEGWLDSVESTQRLLIKANEAGYSHEEWLLPGQDNVYPEVYQPTNSGAHLIVDALCSVHRIDMSKHQYSSSAELYPLFRRYLEATFYNDRNWKAYTRYVKDCRGVEFVNQRDDAFWCFVDCVVGWSWLRNDQPIPRLRGHSDEVKFFNAILPSPYRVKHIVEKSVGFYCHNDDALAGFKKFCELQYLKPIYDQKERTVSIKD
jgi:hypothetical protein